MGIKVDQGHLADAMKLAQQKFEDMRMCFMNWLREVQPEVAEYVNPASTAHIQQLLFGTYEGEKLVENKVFRVDKPPSKAQEDRDSVIEKNRFAGMKVVDLKALCKAAGLKVSGARAVLVQRLLEHDVLVQQGLADVHKMTKEELQARLALAGGLLDEDAEETVEEMRTKLIQDALYCSGLQKNTHSIAMPKNYIDIEIKSLGLKPKDFTPKGAAQVSAAVLKKLAGKNLFDDEKDVVWGEAKSAFTDEETGKKVCRAIGALASMGEIETCINSFLEPLGRLADANSRIHCSLNLNTETGRLSARRPNLQNQPALEKDQFKIRDAFVAEEGKTFIVADYGQLELRILAHITACKSMIDAFHSGGCFHSRTAMSMYPYIAQDVETGGVVLEWDYSKGPPTVPLVKNKYSSERRKAKTLNFSIAYGRPVLLIITSSHLNYPIISALPFIREDGVRSFPGLGNHRESRPGYARCLVCQQTRGTAMAVDDSERST